jgi:hypothetical protein
MADQGMAGFITYCMPGRYVTHLQLSTRCGSLRARQHLTVGGIVVVDFQHTITEVAKGRFAVTPTLDTSQQVIRSPKHPVASARFTFQRLEGLEGFG